MRKVISLAIVAIATSGLAMAAGMDGFFGNTLVIRDAKGALLAKTQFKNDGSYETTRGAATKVTGTWRMDGANVCTKEQDAEDEECVNLNLAGKAKGQSWPVKGNGLDLQLTLE